MRCLDAGRGGTIGRRYTSSSSPIVAIALFTGIGLDSMKLTMQQRQQPLVDRPRAGEVALLGELDHAAHLGGNLVRRHRDDAAAADRHQRQRQRVVARQDDEVSGTPAQISHICVTLPEASFTPTMCGTVLSRISVAGSTLQPVRPGTL